MGIKFTFQNTLFLPGGLMKGWRGDEYYSVCWHTSRSQKPGDLLQVLWILLHRDMLLGGFICKTDKGVISQRNVRIITFSLSMGQGCLSEIKTGGTSLGGTFKCTVVCPKEDGDSGYVVVCWVLTADDAREDYLGPSRIISRQSSVYNITLSESKTEVRITDRDVTPVQFHWH